MFEIYMEFWSISFYLLSRFFFPILFATQSWIVLPKKKITLKSWRDIGKAFNFILHFS